MTGTGSPRERSLVGLIGTLVLGCRGAAGPGEVRLSVRGGREYFAAFADDPLPAGSTVLVIDEGAHRTVTVVAWVDPMSSRSLD